jgi:iron complex transport system substrate-binding protein
MTREAKQSRDSRAASHARLVKKVNRIVTLLPSATEIVCALGFQDQLVGRSHECDYPPEVRRLPVLTNPKFNPEGSSAEVNERVKRIVAEALSVYRVDTEMLRKLKPDVIVTQSQCEVCAVSLREVEDAIAQWVGGAPKIVSLAPYSLGDVMADMQHVADELGHTERGRQLVEGLTWRIKAIEHKCLSSVARPAVACIEWIDPLMAAGNWMPELVAMAGGRNLFGTAGQHSPWMKFEDLLAEDPDVILLSPCGFDMDRTASDLPALTSRPQWQSLKAVRNHQIYLADGNQYFNRPGPRIVESLQILAEILHPEILAGANQDTAWRRL